MGKHFLIGIDEVGRGSLAGPVSVCAFVADKETARWILKNIFDNKLRDSKKLSPQKRSAVYNKLLKLKNESKVIFSVCHTSNKVIDRKGITFAIKKSISKSLKNLEIDDYFKIQNSKFKILLDGSLVAPKEYKNQKTIIRGDEKNVFIACASIIAKVLRDKLMTKLSKKYPNYNFEKHKGYGTFLHKNLIKKYGQSDIHRSTFCRKLIN